MPNFKAKHSLAKFLHDSVGGPTTFRGKVLSEDNQSTVDGVFQLWLSLVWEVCVDGDEARFGRWLQLARGVADCDLFSFLTCLDLAADWLAHSVADPTLRSWSRFKAEQLAQQDLLVMPIRLTFGLLKSRMTRWRASSDVTAFAEMREIVCFPLRMNLTDMPDLADAAYQKWLQSEDSIVPGIRYTGTEQMLISDWFPDTVENRAFLDEHFVPHHGTGSTYEGVQTAAQKYMVSGLDENLHHLLLWCGFGDPYLTHTMQKMWYNPYSVRGTWVPGKGYDPFLAGVAPGTYHRVIGVPKSWKTYRLVSKEPVAYMFFQLGLNYMIQRYLKDGRAPRQLTRGYCVDSEAHNRALAKLGSIDGTYVTIDISAASDSVALAFVRWCFHGSLLETPLRALRTLFAEFDLEVPDYWGTIRVQDILRVAKFAPMGSGICFSVESIVFAAIVVACILRTPGVAASDWAVYGDDIVVRYEVADRVIARLRECGFTPNMGKTFMNPPDESSDFFRESCGGEYLNGIDVTPHRIPRRFKGFPRSKSAAMSDPSSIAQLMSLANDLYDRPAAREVVLYALLSHNIPIYFDEDGTHGVRSPQPTNYHLRSRYNADLQRYEVEAFELYTTSKNPIWHYTDKGVTVEGAYMGEVVLFDYLAAATRSHRKHLLFPEDGVDVRMDPFSTDVKARLVYLPMPISPVSSNVDTSR